MRVALVCSSGGHLKRLRRLEQWWRKHERFWVSFATGDVTSALREEDVVWAHHPTTRNVPNFFKNLALALRVLRQRKPDVVVSSGAGVAVPFFLAAKLYRRKTVYVEIKNRPSLTGRLCYPLSDLFVVQLPEHVRRYPRAHVVSLEL